MEIITFQNLLTAKQVIHVYGFAGAKKDTLPKTGKVLTLTASDVSFRIQKTGAKATYGGPLFRIDHIQCMPAKPALDPYIGSLAEELDNEPFLEGR